MQVTLDRVEQVAPDQASLKAAKKLMARQKWPLLAASDDGALLWGECQGSGATPYRMAVAVHDLGAKCSCPSRKFPCKHSIALMWWRAEHQAEFVSAEVPEWINEWLGRRKGTAPKDPEAPAARFSQITDDAPLDPEAQAKAQKRREQQSARNREQREALITQGLDDLDVWVADQLEQGLVSFGSRAAKQCKALARRMVDAKAGGIAGRIESLASDYFAAPEAVRTDVLIDRLGELRLLAQGFRRQSQLPKPLVADVRACVGWSTSREELLASDAERVAALWTVVGVRRVPEPERLLRVETWLQSDAKVPRTAVLLDFVPLAGSAGAGGYRAGDVLNAELVFYPSSTPLRAQIASHQQQTDERSTSDTAQVPREILDGSLDDGLKAYRQALAQNPFLRQWPISIKGARFGTAGDKALWLAAEGSDAALRIPPAHHAEVGALSGLADVSVWGVFDGLWFVPLAAQTPIGPWWLSAR